jgi:2-hydroxy-3-oxopropionate reductase
MLPDSPDVEEVLLGKDGVLAGARAGLVWIDTSTISPTATRSLVEVAAARRVPSLDAPVTGGEAAAQRGTLTIMVGGAAEQVARSRPILDAFGSKIVHVGGAGAGQVAKACNQVLVGGTIALVAEALLLAAKSGVDPALVREALLGGFAQSRVLEVHGERMLAGQYVPGFRVRLHQKDLGIVAELARAVGLPVVLTAAATQIMNGLTPEERDLDHSALALVYERMAGTALRPSTQGEVA